MEKRIDIRSLKTPANNVFDFDDPDTYVCKVVQVATGHQITRIRIRRDKQSNLPYSLFYLSCFDVRYFQGPMRHHGANFCTAPREELLTLLEQVIGINHSKTDVVSLAHEYQFRELPELRLFTVDLPSGLQVQILSSKVTLSSKTE